MVVTEALLYCYEKSLIAEKDIIKKIMLLKLLGHSFT